MLSSRDFKDLFGLRSASASSVSTDRDAASEDEKPSLHLATAMAQAGKVSPGSASTSSTTSSSSSTSRKSKPSSPKTKDVKSPSAFSRSSASPVNSALQQACLASCGDRLCAAKREEVEAWDVDAVCSFVKSIDLCADYVNVSSCILFFE